MKLKDEAYREITGKAWFDINAGQNIDFTMSLKDMINSVVNYVDNGNKGCCFHASVYLMKLLHDKGIDSEIILTLEPTVLENGEVRNDYRASILVKDDDKYVVMNPIEDIEFFEKNSIQPKDRENYYNGTELNGEKGGIHSKDAANIGLADFIERYGNGSAWTLGTLYQNDFDTMTFQELWSCAKSIDVSEYIPSQK